MPISAPKIYFISGLGADERIFEFIGIEGCEISHIRWVAPCPGESLKEYAARLSTQIETARPIILGVSFGGMIAVELAKQIDCEQIILVSSAKTKNDIPFYYRFIGKLNLHHVVPAGCLKRAGALTYWLFGMKTKTEKRLLQSILADTDAIFLKWAIGAILQWDNTIETDRSLQIHGTADKILPLKHIKYADHVIENGGHLMIYNCANKINAILNEGVHRKRIN